MSNQEALIDGSEYDAETIPKVGDLKADRILVHINGVIELDRLAVDDTDWLAALALGRDVKIPGFTGTVVDRPQRYSPSDDGPGTVTVGAVVKFKLSLKDPAPWRVG